MIPRETVNFSGDGSAVSTAVGNVPDAEMTETSPYANVLADDGIISTTVELSAQPANGVSDAASEDEVEAVNGVATLHSHRHPAKPGKPSIMERFARIHGFRRDCEDRFFHPDGSWIAKPSGTPFWERRTANGDLVRYYWPKDHCLEREPLQIDADIWGLIDKFPDTYALILSDNQDDALEITGARLRAMRDGGNLKFYPATYRLVYQEDRSSTELPKQSGVSGINEMDRK